MDKYFVLIDPFARPEMTPFDTPPLERQGVTTLPGRFDTLSAAKSERRQCNIGGDLLIYQVEGTRAKLVD